jgi:hypothetical protein
MPRLTKIRLVRPGVRKLLRGEPMEKEMLRRAKNVAGQARANAPVVTGAYKDSITAFTWVGKNRVRGLAEAQIWYAPIVEAKYRVLGRAFDAARGD